ncbi:MAG: hypothetical protein ABFR05_03445 [Bacteroidota bacterium]
MTGLQNTFLILLFSISGLFAQQNSLKEEALGEFEKEHYDNAIDLLEKALGESPDDAEIYYYLGFFNHYRAYDSRPLKGYNFEYSNEIFKYLDKAIELDPNYGNAKYFYGAECSGNAFVSMQNYDLDKLKYFYKLAYDKGAYPKWLLEFGRNMLNSCAKDAIMFTAGNADFDVCTYLQLHENFRNDITIIPIGNIDRPWYINFLKNGLQGGVRPIQLSLTKDQIFDMHPFKWRETIITIPVNKILQEKYNVENTDSMQWLVKPDLKSDRDHSKIEGQEVKKRTYLSPRIAMLLQIVEDNFEERPIYGSNLGYPFFYAGLDKFFESSGFVSRLTPVKTAGTEFEYDFENIEKLLQKDNLKDYSSVKESNIPRISGIAFVYHRVLVELATYYKENNELDKLEDLKKFYSDYLEIGFNDKNEKYYLEKLEEL